MIVLCWPRTPPRGHRHPAASNRAQERAVLWWNGPFDPVRWRCQNGIFCRAGRGGCAAALAAAGAAHLGTRDNAGGSRNKPDEEKRLERCNDPARNRDGKPYGEDRGEELPMIQAI